MAAVGTAVVSFRVPIELKRKMDELRGEVNWSEELRRFVERRVRELEQLKASSELESTIERLPSAPKGTAAGYVREDRDRN